MNPRRAVIALSMLFVAILACNAPAGGSPTPDLPATITAQAVLLQSPASTAADVSTPVTGTPSTTQVSVTSVTNCRTGPSQAYDLIFTANPGPSFQVVGKYTPGNYWIINNPAGGTCWLWGQYAVVTGDTAGLPEYPAPPAPPKNTKTPKPTKQATETATSTQSTGGGTFKPPIITLIAVVPSTPTNFAQTRTCAGGFNGVTPIWIEDVYLKWDPSAGQTGYRIYKNNSSISTLPSGATEFHIQLRYDQGTGGSLFDNFGVEAFNNFGASGRPSLDVPRCP